MMAEPADRFYESQGLRLHYVDWGNEAAPPLILIHGGLDHCRNWDAIARELQPHFHIMAPDLRGHGDSEWAKGSSYSLVDHVYDLTRLTRFAELQDAAIVGHSMGGMVSQLLVLEHPEVVRALVLVDTAAEVPKGLLYDERRKQRAWLVETAREKGMEAVFVEQERITPLHPALAANPQYIDIWREQFLMTSREAYIAGANGMASRRSVVGDLAKVSVPTLVICGEKDEPFLEPSRQMHAAIPGSELIIIPGAGHGPQMETPGEFNRALTEFLAKVRETTAV